MGRIRDWIRTRATSFFGLDSEGWSIVWGQQPTTYQQTGLNVRVLGWERNAVVQACARLIAEETASVQLEAFRELKDGKIELLPGHELETLMYEPRAGMCGRRLQVLTDTHFLIYGNAFWILERTGRAGTGRVAAIRLVHPEDIVYCWLDRKTLEIETYEWRDRAGTLHKTSWEDVVHFRDVAAGDWLFGYPRAAAALLEISSDNEASQYVRQVVTNNGVPGVLMKVPAETTNKEMRRAKQRYTEEFTKRGGRGGLMVIRGADELTQIGFNLQQLEFPDLRAVTREGICAAFGVDPRMVGIGSARGAEGGLSGQQYVEARKRLLSTAVRPLMDALEAEWNYSLTPEYGDAQLRFSPDDLRKLTQDDTELSTRTLAEFRANLIGRKEARITLGRPAEIEGDDEFYSDVAFGGFNPFGALGGDNGNGDKPKQLPPGRDEDDDEEIGAARSRVFTRAVTLSRAQRAALWREFDTRATKEERDYRQTAMVLFHEERARVRELFLENAPQRSLVVVGRAKGEDPFIRAALERALREYAPGGDFHRHWLEQYQRLLQRTMFAAAEEIAAAGGLDFSLVQPRVLEAVIARAGRLSELVTRETASQVTLVVEQGVEQGLGMKQIADLIDDAVFDSQAPMRSTRIARTETIGSLNQGEFVSADAAGIFREKEWLSQGDDRVRFEHEDLDGVRMPMDAEFAPGLLHPGDQRAEASQIIQCRCTLLYHT